MNSYGMSTEENNLYEYHKDGFTVSTNPDRLDINVIHKFLHQAYWSRGIPKELIIKAIRYSFCFGLYQQDKLIGFARVITDYATHAEICDVFVLEPYQRQGLGKWMMECIVLCPKLQGLRILSLGMDDAHEFYKKIGFEIVGDCSNRLHMLYDRPWFITT